MAFDKTPTQWLGAGYTLGSSSISLETATKGLTSLGAATAAEATDIITVTAHGRKIGDVVQFTTTDTLPAGLTVGTNYYVLTVPTVDTLTVSATLNGTVVNITDAGTGTHTMNRLSTVPELTDTEANASAGDIRKIYYALAEAFYQSYNRTPTANRPSQMSIFKSISNDISTGTDTVTFTMRFVTEVPAGSREVADEPA